MAQKQISLKRVGVDKANARIVTITAVASFIVVFCIVASVSLFSQLMYQNRVAGVKKKAVAQLKENLKARDDLVASYKSFVSTPQNILGGNPGGNGPKDGNNAKIVLDALPSAYDFPALTSSLEKILTQQGVKIKSMTGTDDAIAQSSNKSGAAPQVVDVPFEVTIEGNYNSVKNALMAMEHSIRPFQIEKTDITGNQAQLDLTISGKTYYQPEKNLSIKMEVVK